MTVIRARQGALTRTHPHNANRTHLIPGGQRQWRNVLHNSAWVGVGGNESVGNFTGPAGWNLEFWPPADAEAWPGNEYQGCEFFATQAAGRGFFGQTVQVNEGQLLNISVYVDKVGAPLGSVAPVWAAQIVDGALLSVVRAPIIPTGAGRVDGVWRCTQSGLMQARFGAGTNGAEATAEPQFVLSRPQMSWGEALLPWQRRGLPAGRWNETIRFQIGENAGQDNWGFLSTVYGSATPSRLFTHNLLAFVSTATDNLILRLADQKNFGMQKIIWRWGAREAILSAVGGDRFEGYSAGVGAAMQANVGSFFDYHFELIE